MILYCLQAKEQSTNEINFVMNHAPGAVSIAWHFDTDHSADQSHRSKRYHKSHRSKRYHKSHRSKKYHKSHRSKRYHKSHRSKRYHKSHRSKRHHKRSIYWQGVCVQYYHQRLQNSEQDDLTFTPPQIKTMSMWVKATRRHIYSCWKNPTSFGNVLSGVIFAVNKFSVLSQGGKSGTKTFKMTEHFPRHSYLQ